MTITEPAITANAILLAGFLGGKVGSGPNPGPYHVTAVDAAAATMTIKHERNGNTYRVTVEQIGGVE